MTGKDVGRVTGMTTEELLASLARDVSCAELQVYRLRRRLFWWRLFPPMIVALGLGLVLYSHEEEYQHTHPEVEVGPVQEAEPEHQDPRPGLSLVPNRTEPAWFDYRVYGA